MCCMSFTVQAIASEGTVGAGGARNQGREQLTAILRVLGRNSFAVPGEMKELRSQRGSKEPER